MDFQATGFIDFILGITEILQLTFQNFENNDMIPENECRSIQITKYLS